MQSQGCASLTDDKIVDQMIFHIRRTRHVDGGAVDHGQLVYVTGDFVDAAYEFVVVEGVGGWP